MTPRLDEIEHALDADPLGARLAAAVVPPLSAPVRRRLMAAASAAPASRSARGPVGVVAVVGASAVAAMLAVVATGSYTPTHPGIVASPSGGPAETASVTTPLPGAAPTTTRIPITRLAALDAVTKIARDADANSPGPVGG